MPATALWALFAALFISAGAYSNRQRSFAEGSSDRNVPDLSAPLLIRAQVAQKPPVQVRFSLLQPSNDTASLRNIQELMGRISGAHNVGRTALCWAETNLVPAITASPAFGRAPQYVVYTDNHTHSYAQETYREFPRHRYKLVNLDLDPRDATPGPNSRVQMTRYFEAVLPRIRMAPFRYTPLDDKNRASVRRTLADSDHLSVQSGRLLLGTDVKFLHPPRDFVEAASKLPRQQAIYMIDRFWEGETVDGQPVSKVKMNRSGPQCPGLLGDFIYLSPGLQVTLENLQSKMTWYIQQPRTLDRTIPRCPQSCLASNGLHAVDQFALVLALGEAVKPAGEGCFALDAEAYSHWYPRTPRTLVTHDKAMDECTLHLSLSETLDGEDGSGLLFLSFSKSPLQTWSHSEVDMARTRGTPRLLTGLLLVAAVAIGLPRAFISVPKKAADRAVSPALGAAATLAWAEQARAVSEYQYIAPDRSGQEPQYFPNVLDPKFSFEDWLNNPDSDYVVFFTVVTVAVVVLNFLLDVANGLSEALASGKSGNQQ
eukprot:s235_g10.t1